MDSLNAVADELRKAKAAMLSFVPPAEHHIVESFFSRTVQAAGKYISPPFSLLCQRLHQRAAGPMSAYACCRCAGVTLVMCADDVADIVFRSGACLCMPLASLPGRIAAEHYGLSEPPEAASSWVEDLSVLTTSLQTRLQALPSLPERAVIQVDPHSSC